jgi:ADP-ribosyl-[dinitrogen reductase] hydrolase
MLKADKKKLKAVGSLIGLAIGDAMGVTQEIFPKGSLKDTIKMVLRQREGLAKNPQKDIIGNGPWKDHGVVLEPGDFTDDTSMALCLADSLIIKSGLDPPDLMERFIDWWDNGTNASIRIKQDGKIIGKSVGLGHNVNLAMQRYKKNKSNPIAGGSNPDKDAGNGAIMRMAPIAIFWYYDVNKAIEMAKLQASVTHNVSEAMDACALMAYFICLGIAGKSKDEIFGSLESVISKLTNKDIIELAGANAKWKTKKDEQIVTLPGRTLWSLEAALYCVYNTNSFSEAIVKSVNLGGDADTVTAVTGQLAGALYGFDQIPIEWIKTLKHTSQIIKKALALFNKTKFTLEMVI